MAAKTEKKYYSISQFYEDVAELWAKIKHQQKDYLFVHGVPQGGVPLALALASRSEMTLIGEEEFQEVGPDEVLIVDDLIDSGRTRANYNAYDFACLHMKANAPPSVPEEYGRTFYVHGKNSEWGNAWIIYWWEGTQQKSIEDSVLRQLQFLGEDIAREGLVETPARVIRSWDKLYGGYNQKAKDVLKTFDNATCDEIVLLKDIELYSTCEHHMLPFFGKAHIAYIPGRKIVGISKLARLLEVYSRRLQIQERIGVQVTDALMQYLHPQGAACIIEAQHFCMRARGVEKQNSVMVTSSLKGAFLDKPEARSELMGLIK